MRLFGITDDVEGMNESDEEGDADLEAEMAAITGGGSKKNRPKSKSGINVSSSELDAMVASSLRDIVSDDEESGDDNDPDLLNELAGITGEEMSEAVASDCKVSETMTDDTMVILKSRIEMYILAEQNVIKLNDTSKARRYNRAIKTLRDLIRQTENGKIINKEEIPPEINVKINSASEAISPSESANPLPPPIPARKAPAPPQTINSKANLESSKIEDETEVLTKDKIDFLNARKNEYKLAALTFKNNGDKETAIQYIRICKQFDTVIAALVEGKEVDLSNMPPSPTLPTEIAEINNSNQEAAKEQSKKQNAANENIKNPNEEEPILKVASTIAEALEQRIEVYKVMIKKSEDEQNSSKARRYGRIVKQYQDAIKLHKGGKSVALDELPVPPGFGPFPNEIEKVTETPKVSVLIPTKPEIDPRNKTQSSATIIQQSGAQTRLDKQLEILINSKMEFRKVAIEAKKSGNIEAAKEYLRTCKQFDALIEKAEGGFTVDMSSLPIPPGKREVLEDTFTVLDENDVDESENANVEDSKGDEENGISIRLQEQLAKQLMMCKNTRDHFRAMGEVASMNRFENLALGVQKDLDFVRLAHKEKLRTPKFHYEQKNFTIIKCNTDLNDNEVEINILRGINYTVPNPRDVDTYVKLEFPYPQVI